MHVCVRACVCVCVCWGEQRWGGGGRVREGGDREEKGEGEMRRQTDRAFQLSSPQISKTQRGARVHGFGT